MSSDNIDDVIAHRVYKLEGREEKVEVQLGRPRTATEFGYSCPFKIVGAGTEDLKYAKGVDAIHALQAALLLIGVTLDHYNERLGGILRWEGSDDGGLGFP